MRSLLLAMISLILITSAACNECKNVNCMNGGVCNDGDCTCPSGYTGKYCETQKGVCDTSYDESSATVNLFDKQIGSPFYNQVVAVFKFKQVTKKLSGAYCYNSGLQSSTTLVIQNTTNKKISFDYYVSWALNAGSWTYQNFASINANGTQDVGFINDNAGIIGKGVITIQSSAISYQ